MTQAKTKLLSFDQEEIYRLLFQEKWNDLLQIIYQHNDAIQADPLLDQASKLIESEFFKKVSAYPLEEESIIEALETFYQLDYRKQYLLSDEHKALLFDELAYRRPTNYGHYKQRSKDSDDKNIVSTPEKAKDPHVFVPSNDPLPSNWITAYNRLFELINVSGDPDTYFSGPKFINVIRLFSPYHPDYEQYMSERKRLGKSESRKIYYKDLLQDLSYQVRMNTIDKVLETVKPHDPYRVEELEVLLYGKAKNKEANVVSEEKTPTVFISYSWDSPDHKLWVLNLAKKLKKDGIEVIIDRHVLRAGSNAPHFIEQSIAKADKVLVIFTPNYKLKADNRAGGVGYEYSILNATLYKNQVVNDKIIPVLRSGAQSTSIPDFMHQYIHIDFTDDKHFESSYLELNNVVKNIPFSLD